jgi:hypothetical protein
MIARRLGQGSPSRNRSTSDLSEFLYVRNHFSVLLLGLLRLPLLIFCPGRDLSEFEFRVCDQCCDTWRNRQLVSEAFQALCSSPSVRVSLSIKPHFGIVSRMLSSLRDSTISRVY